MQMGLAVAQAISCLHPNKIAVGDYVNTYHVGCVLCKIPLFHLVLLSASSSLSRYRIWGMVTVMHLMHGIWYTFT